MPTWTPFELVKHHDFFCCLCVFYLVLRGCASSMWPLAGPVVDDPVPEQRQINTCVNLQLFSPVLSFPSSPHTHTTSQCALFSSLLFAEAIKKGHQPKSNGQAAQTKTHTPQISCDFPATSRRQQRKGEPAKIHRFFMPALPI